MTQKFILLLILTFVLAIIAGGLIWFHPAQIVPLVDTILGALIGAFSLGVHAVFRDASPPPAAPAQQETVK